MIGDKEIGWYEQEMKNELDPTRKKIYQYHIEFLKTMSPFNPEKE